MKTQTSKLNKGIAFQKNRILLTGASVMVGRAVLGNLLSDFPDILIRAVRFANSQDLQKSPRVEWVRADLRSMADCRAVAAGCDSAIMAAANTTGSLGMAKEPWRTMNDNVIMNSRLLEAFHLEGIRRFVFISSATAYQDFEGAIKEVDLDLNTDPYAAHFGVGWAMRFTEKMCRFWHEKAGIEAVILRAANIYGPYSTFDPQRSNVIPALIRKAVDRMDPFEVWGSPDVIRDVIYVSDFADAVVKSLRAREIKFDVFNVGSFDYCRVGDIVECVLECANHRPFRIKYLNKVPVTNKIRRLDCTKIKSMLHWTPRHALQDGILETTSWWIENKKKWKK